MKVWKKAAGLLAAGVAAYLLVAAAWAWATFDQAIALAAPPASTPLSARQVDILTRVEDPDFFAHAGVSLANGQGFATISGAIAREVYLDGPDFDGVGGALQALYRRVFDCCKRIDLGRDVMAVVLNARLPKKRQLALYASRVYMGTHRGQQIRGLPRAATSYLGKPLAATTDREFVKLVAMIKAPNRYHPVRDPAAWTNRVARIEALLSRACRADGWFDTQLAGCGQ